MPATISFVVRRLKTAATYEDLVAVPENLVAEIFDGELYASPRPALPHAHAASVLNMELGGAFHRGRNGPGGWWLLNEPELHFGRDVVVPDLAGWRRERLPALPPDAYLTLAPDWVCEVLSSSTEALDRGKKLQIYAREQVAHVWLVNPMLKTLEVLSLTADRWTLTATYEGGAHVRAEPFDAVEIELRALWVWPDIPHDCRDPAMANSDPMSAARPLAAPPDASTTDHFVYLQVGWQGYERLLAMRGERPVPRMTYLEGVVELMSPSRYHEADKKRFARLLEAWSETAGVALEGYGSWTLKDQKAERGTEPDECYCVRRLASDDEDRPDIAIEVVWTSGGIDKLEVYRKLGVREVWFYERGSLRFFTLRADEDLYSEIARSELIPELPVDLLLACMNEPGQTAAIRALRAALVE